MLLLEIKILGHCSGINHVSINWISSNFPGLDSAGCGAFEFSNITFVSVNTVALLCGNNMLCFSVEKLIERESTEFRTESDQSSVKLAHLNEMRFKNGETGWKENTMLSGSGPVVLLHFPMHDMTKDNYWGGIASDGAASHFPESRGRVGKGPYELSQTLPLNASEYIFQALRPRMVFSAHTHESGDRIHSDGTRDIIVPAMTWDARDDPGFVFATFRKNGTSVSSCSLAKESYVLTANYICSVYISNEIGKIITSHIVVAFISKI